MKVITLKHVVGTCGLMVLLACGAYIMGIPAWAVSWIAIAAILGPVLLYLFADDPPFPDDGSTIICIPPD